MRTFLRSIVVVVLSFEARMLLALHRPRIIAVSGSVGKTSTKDAIFAVVANRYSARKSHKSFNSEFGVPLTILGLSTAWNSPFGWLLNMVLGAWRAVFSSNYPKYLILEMGSDHPGDIQALVRWVKPDIAVMTRFPDLPVHVEFFNDPEDVLREDFLVADAASRGGSVILNGDDQNLERLSLGIRTKIIRYGLDPRNQIRASRDELLYNDDGTLSGISVTIRHQGSDTVVDRVGVVGMQHIYPLLAAYAVGLELRIDHEAIVGALAEYVPPAGRMRLIEGIKGVQIIDDTYNSSPVAVDEALATLVRARSRGRKIAALGSMRELGSHSHDAHMAAGKRAALSCDILITVGTEARNIAEGALDAGMDEGAIFQFDTSKEAGEFVQNMLQDGDLILIKGSQSIRMEHMTKEIMLHPEHSQNLLVRQEFAWEKR